MHASPYHRQFSEKGGKVEQIWTYLLAFIPAFNQSDSSISEGGGRGGMSACKPISNSKFGAYALKDSLPLLKKYLKLAVILSSLLYQARYLVDLFDYKLYLCDVTCQIVQ